MKRFGVVFVFTVLFSHSAFSADVPEVKVEELVPLYTHVTYSPEMRTYKKLFSVMRSLDGGRRCDRLLRHCAFSEYENDSFFSVKCYSELFSTSIGPACILTFKTNGNSHNRVSERHERVFREAFGSFYQDNGIQVDCRGQDCYLALQTNPANI